MKSQVDLSHLFKNIFLSFNCFALKKETSHLKFDSQTALSCATNECVGDHGQQPARSKLGSINSNYKLSCNILLDAKYRTTSIR